MYSKKSKRFLTLVLAIMAAFILCGAVAWAANDVLEFSSTAAQTDLKGNNGKVTASQTTASTSVYSVPTVPAGGVKIDVKVGGGTFADGAITLSTDSPNWKITSSVPNGTTIAPGTLVTLASNVDAYKLTASEDVKITATDTKGHAESITLAVAPVLVSLPIAAKDVVLYDGADYLDDGKTINKGVRTAFDASGRTFAVKDVSVKAGVNIFNSNDLVWPDPANVKANMAKDASGNQTGMYFYSTAKSLTGGPQPPVSFTVNADDESSLFVPGDAGAIVAGVATGTQLVGFKALVGPAVLTLSETSKDFVLDAAASGTVTATIQGKDIAALKIVNANTDIKSADVHATMAGGLVLEASVASTTPPTGKIAFSGTPKSEDKAVFKVIAYGDKLARDKDVIASADLTVTVVKSQPAAGYAMTVENFAAVAGKDAGTQTHAVAFKKDGAVVAMPVLDTLAFTQPSDPADPSKVVWNGLTLVADRATGKVTMTGTPQTDGNKNFTLHATSQAGTIADWTFHVTVSKNQPTPSSGGSGGCDAGFGLVGLLAAGAFVGLFRRGR